MELEEIRDICMALPGTTESIKWEHHLVFSVGDKMYCVTGMHEVPITASFKVPDDDFEEMSSRQGFTPAAYMARNKWVWTGDINTLNRKEWEKYLKQSYELVKAKLTAKKRKEIDGLASK